MTGTEMSPVYNIGPEEVSRPRSLGWRSLANTVVVCIRHLGLDRLVADDRQRGGKRGS
jgi:hypothetical protein